MKFYVVEWSSIFIFSRKFPCIKCPIHITSSRRGFTRVPAANGILIAKSILNDRVIFDSGLLYGVRFSRKKGGAYIDISWALASRDIHSLRINIYQSSREHDVFVVLRRGNRCLNAVERFMVA